MQRHLRRRLRGRKSLSASLLVLLVTLVLLVPVLSYGTLLLQQATGLVEWLGPRLEPSALEKLWRETSARYPKLMSWVHQTTGENAMSLAGGVVAKLAGQTNKIVQAALAGLAAAALDALIFLMMLFFLLRDGEELKDALTGVSPLTSVQERELADHLFRTIKGVVQSMVIVPLAQGVVAILGFWIFGLPSPLLWGVAVTFAALIPIVGTPLIWVPAGLYFFLTGSTIKGVGMLLWGVLIISGIDNVVKPLILKGAAQIHMMLGFLSILGGVYAFGPKGIIVGPVVLSLVLSAYRIYRYDVLRWRSEEAALPAAPPGPPPG
jgi:predicted PurR-regulated permease PerM